MAGRLVGSFRHGEDKEECDGGGAGQARWFEGWEGQGAEALGEAGLALAEGPSFVVPSALWLGRLNGMEELNVGAMLKLQRAFVDEREWKKFHTPKNLSMALAGEAAELMEIFQWLSQAESRSVMKNPAKAKAVAHELADVFYYLLRLADVLGVNLETAFWEKMRHNQRKYPVKLARGNAKKYNELLAFKGLNPR